MTPFTRLALDTTMAAFLMPYPHNVVSYDTQARNTHTAETTRRHALKDYEGSLKLVQALECKLEVTTCWVPEDVEWQRVGRLVANRKYQRAVDRLEGLVVARIFELMKMNRAGTGEFQ